MSGGVGGVPARILLSGGAFKPTKNSCPEASGGWLCKGGRGGPGEDFAEWGGLHTYEKPMPTGLRKLAMSGGRGGPGVDFAEWGGHRTYEKPMPRGRRKLAMSGGVGGIPARILLR